jgi:hypothetical protein
LIHGTGIVELDPHRDTAPRPANSHPKVGYRHAAHAGISRALPLPQTEVYEKVTQPPKFGRPRKAAGRRTLEQQGRVADLAVPAKPAFAKLLTDLPEGELGGLRDRLGIGADTLAARCREPIEE